MSFRSKELGGFSRRRFNGETASAARTHDFFAAGVNHLSVAIAETLARATYRNAVVD
jgi:hypothetical protein